MLAHGPVNSNGCCPSVVVGPLMIVARIAATSALETTLASTAPVACRAAGSASRSYRAASARLGLRLSGSAG